MRALPLAVLLACAAHRGAPAPAPAPMIFVPRSIDEAEFRAQHTHAEAPPPRGPTVDLGGAHGYLSLPPGMPPGTELGAIVAIHDASGLNDDIRRWADRLAAEGYAALAVDLYDGKTTADAASAAALAQAADRAEAVRKLLAAYEFLATDPRIHATRRAAVGWGFGGAMALELALAAPDLDAAVVYYGPPVTDAARLRAVHARLFGVFGTRDEIVPLDDVAAFERAARDAGVSLAIERYDARHAFADPSDPRYDEAAAGDAWSRARSFLREALRAAPAVPVR